MNDRATLNDTFRKSWKDVVFTSTVMTRIEHHFALTQAIHDFTAFDEDNDPYGEHDFGALNLEGERILWKIDYYDQSLGYWCDPLDPKCRRVMTVMLAEDY
jgi:hypothetical protein